MSRVILIFLLLGRVCLGANEASSNAFVRRRARLLGDVAQGALSVNNSEQGNGVVAPEINSAANFEPPSDGSNGDDGTNTPILNMTYHGGNVSVPQAPVIEEQNNEAAQQQEEDASPIPEVLLSEEKAGENATLVSTPPSVSPVESAFPTRSEVLPEAVESSEKVTGFSSAPSPFPTKAPLETPSPTAAPRAEPVPETEQPTLAKESTRPTVSIPSNEPPDSYEGDNRQPSWSNAFEHPTDQQGQDPNEQGDSEEPPDDAPDDAKTAIEILENEAEEILDDRNVDIVAAILIVAALLLMICLAQQMVENPDGSCAKLCRCTVATCRIITYPLRACFCCCCMSSRDKDRRTHDLIATNGYGFDEYDHDLRLT